MSSPQHDNNQDPERKENPLFEGFSERDLLLALIDHMPDFIYIKDRDSKFILANKKLADTHGLESGMQMSGKSDYDYYPADLADKFYRNEQDIMASGTPIIGQEEKGLNEQGEDIHVSTTKIPLRNGQGKVIGIVGIGRDITPRKNAELKAHRHAEELEKINALLNEKQNELEKKSGELIAQTRNLQKAMLESEKLATALSETDDVVGIMDADCNLEWVNKSFTRMYGQTLEEFTAERGSHIADCSLNPDIREYLTRCQETGKTVLYHSEVQDKKGKTFWVQSTLTPILDETNRITQYVVIDADITELKKAQDMISQQKAELETRGRELEQANRTKDKFFSIIAHDLKNPFHTIIGFTELISLSYDEFPDEKKKEFISMIHDSSMFANNLLDNLLHWSRTQSKRIVYSPAQLDLRLSVSETLRLLGSSMEKKNVRFENLIPADTNAWADPNMIKTVIRNLLSNAVKITPDGGSIQVSCKKDGERWVVSVRDTGIGIHKDRQKSLFDFGDFETTSGTEGEPGTGLGLLICNEFVKKHGGTLDLDSSPGKGSTFSFDIPVYAQQEKHP